MPYGITQCYLSPGSSDFPAFTPAKAGTRFSDPEGCKAELNWVVISEDSLRAKYSTLYFLPQKNQKVSWLRIEPTTESRKSKILTTKPSWKVVQTHVYCNGFHTHTTMYRNVTYSNLKLYHCNDDTEINLTETIPEFFRLRQQTAGLQPC